MVVKSPKSHEKCLLCGERNRIGMNLSFSVVDDKSVETIVDTGLIYQGYSGILHGGVISSLLDCAMCHALFNMGIEAVTGDMKISFHREIPALVRLELKAKVIDDRGPIFKTESYIYIDGVKYASGSARFVKRK